MHLSIWLVAYDIPCDRRRGRVAAILEAFGYRVQYSVFEVRLSGPALERLQRLLAEAIAPEADHIRLYPLCRTCVRGAQVLGRGDPIATAAPRCVAV